MSKWTRRPIKRAAITQTSSIMLFFVKCYWSHSVFSGLPGLHLPRLPELVHGQWREEAGGLRRARESSGADPAHAGHQPHQYRRSGPAQPGHQLPGQHPPQRHHSHGGACHGRLPIWGGARQPGLWRFAGDAVWLLRSGPPSPSAVSSHTHSPTPTTTTAAPPSPCWVASPIGSYSGGARTKAATVTGGSEGHQLKLRRRPPSKRPKLHHACGLAYREEEKKEEM